MKQNVNIRKRKSVKQGITYEYRFEAASISGQRKWISKGGFKDENMARMEGIKALNEYNTCGKVVKPSTMSFADFLEHWLVNDCTATLNEITIINYRKKIKNLIVLCAIITAKFNLPLAQMVPLMAIIGTMAKTAKLLFGELLRL